jgi:hypothetical protein
MKYAVKLVSGDRKSLLLVIFQNKECKSNIEKFSWWSSGKVYCRLSEISRITARQWMLQVALYRNASTQAAFSDSKKPQRIQVGL